VLLAQGATSTRFFQLTKQNFGTASCNLLKCFCGYCDNSVVKYIIAVIRPEKLDVVKEELRKIDVSRMTVSEVQGYGRQRGYIDESVVGPSIRFVRKVKLEIAVNDEFVEPTIQTILKYAKSEGEGRIGDGKIFVLPLEDVIRVRTGERGREAI